MGEKKIESIVESYEENKKYAPLAKFLCKPNYKISENKLKKIYDKYKEKAVDKISKNPYILYEDIYGFGFITTDNLALSLGIKKDSDLRLRAAVIYSLKDAAENNQHVFLTKKELFAKFIDLFRNDIEDEYYLSEEYFEDMLNQMADENKIFIYNDNDVYLKYLYNMEMYIANACESFIKCNDRINDINKLIKECEEENNIKYAPKQKEAIMCSGDENFIIITGGPGTGKSTIIKAIIQILKKHNPNIKISICAPTGRAAQRAEETTGYEASTLHRLLKFNPYKGYAINENNKLDTDVIIIDEGGMMDIPEMYHVLKGLKENTKIIIMGDADQISSIGVGNVFKDLIDSGRIPVVFLNEVFRQGDGSSIKVNTRFIKMGNVKLEKAPGEFEICIQSNKDMEKVEKAAIDKYVAFVEAEEAELKNHKKALFETQVITPIKKGTLGTYNLNSKIQSILNPSDRNRNQITYEIREKGKSSTTKIIFRVGDKIMQIKNNYDYEVFNGDMGMIKDIEKNEEGRVSIDVEFEDGRILKYEKSELIENIMLAYVITSYKCQGSEFDKVIVVNSISHAFALDRNMFYTCVSRAKKEVAIVGDMKALYLAIKNVKAKKRNSNLKNFLMLNNAEYKEELIAMPIY